MMWQVLIPLLGNLLDKVFPDPKAADEAKLRVMEMAQKGELEQLAAEVTLAKAQIETNRQEAANASLFVSGWRPAVGWCCAAGLAYQFLGRPIAISFGWPAPGLEMETLLTLLGGMLGLGTLRTAEKVKGVA